MSAQTRPHHKEDLLRISVVAVSLLLSWLNVWQKVASFDFIAIVATIIGGYPMFKEVFGNIRERRMTMEFSMSIAVLATLLIQQYFTGLVITFFVLIAEYLEHELVAKGRTVIEKLIALLPQKATVRKGGEERESEIKDIELGDIVIIKPGSAIPVDGVVMKGNSFVDQSSLTGEPIPVEKMAGQEVFAGTFNQTGVLEVGVKKIGLQTTFGKIITIIEKAESTKAPIQKTADKLAAKLVYLAFAGALITWLFTNNMVSAISALIAAGACGVAAGTPLAILASIGRVAKTGVIVKGGIYLEQMALINTLIFDKTGTVTIGKPTVTNIQNFTGISKESILQMAASVEQHAEHPIGLAIKTYAANEKLLVSFYKQIKTIPGKGIIATIGNDEVAVGNNALLIEKETVIHPAIIDHVQNEKKKGCTTVFVIQNNIIVGTISVADVLRPEAKQAIEEIQKLNCKVLLVTGDERSISNSVARSLGVDEVYAEMLPAEKLERIQALMRKGNKIAMIGDGINDAAALTAANVGIAMSSGTDITMESADMILMNNNLLRVVDVIQISRQCLNVIMFNFWGTVIVDIIAISLAFAGFLTPLSAALIHVISELIFILNSARLFRK